MNVELIKKGFAEIALENINKQPSQDLIDFIALNATAVMYDNGFSDDKNDFNPVIPNVNLKVESEKRKLIIAFKPKPGEWIEIRADYSI